ncbi:MAG TPA: hypothetical protein VGF45_07070 [Polyangia bacterium]
MAFALATCGGTRGGDTRPDAGSPCWSEPLVAAAPPPSVSTTTSPETWLSLGDAVLSAEEQTAAVVLDVPPMTAAVVLRVSDPTGAPTCVQLASLIDSRGVDWVAATDRGPYCVGCLQRVSIGIGHGLFVLPSNDQPVPFTTGGPFQIRAAAVECPNPGDSPRALPSRLRIEARFRSVMPAGQPGLLTLGLAFASTSPLADPTRRREVVPETLRLLNQMLAPGDLAVVASVRTAPLELSDPLALERGDNGPLAVIAQELQSSMGCTPKASDPTRQPAWVPLVFAGCLRLRDADLQTEQQPDALVPGIPSGLPPPGRADGIYVKGRSCRAGGDAIDWAPASLAKLIAHELGHYLGLYHSVEADGTTDQLADTDADNIMSASPLATKTGFSAAQFRVMRRHPAVRF